MLSVLSVSSLFYTYVSLCPRRGKRGGAIQSQVLFIPLVSDGSICFFKWWEEGEFDVLCQWRRLSALIPPGGRRLLYGGRDSSWVSCLLVFLYSLNVGGLQKRCLFVDVAVVVGGGGGVASEAEVTSSNLSYYVQSLFQCYKTVHKCRKISFSIFFAAAHSVQNE